MKISSTTTALLLASLTVTTHGFLVVPTPGNAFVLNAEVDNEIDFDAPASRVLAVGNAVRSPPSSSPFAGLPEFLAKAFGVLPTLTKKKEENTKEEMDNHLFMDLDEECYLGKDGTLDECVDFDPPHSASP